MGRGLVRLCNVLGRGLHGNASLKGDGMSYEMNFYSIVYLSLLSPLWEDILL